MPKHKRPREVETQDFASLLPNSDKPKPKGMCSKLRNELISQQLLQRKEAAPLAEKEPQRV
ncbi:hypothetical protein KKE26_10615 [bacterium]|nr:hypothetical protein [bacterium]MBU1753751.1 hypothetical protein [bacterium]